MTTTKKTQYHHGDLARALIDASLVLLSERGPEAISMREIARQAGVSHGAPAHHFGDKAGLFTAAAIDGQQLLAAALGQAIAGATGTEAQLKAAGEAYIRFAVGHPGQFNIMFQSEQIDRQNPDYKAAAETTRSHLEQCVATFLGDKAEQRHLTAVVTALWSQVHGFSCLWLAGNFGDPADEALLGQMLRDMLSSIIPQ